MDKEDIIEIIGGIICWGGLFFMVFMGFVVI